MKCKIWEFKKLLLIVTVTALIFIQNQTIAQNIKNSTSNVSRFSVCLATGNHTVGFPYQNLFSTYNPVVDAGLDFRINNSTKHAFLIGLNSCFAINSKIGNTYMSGLNLGYKYTNKSGFFGGLALNIGSIFQFYPNDTYTYNTDTHIFEPSDSKAFFAPYSGFSTILGYNISEKFNSRYSVFLKTRFVLQSSYFNSQAFPIMPQNISEIGVNIKFNKSSK